MSSLKKSLRRAGRAVLPEAEESAPQLKLELVLGVQVAAM